MHDCAAVDPSSILGRTNTLLESLNNWGKEAKELYLCSTFKNRYTLQSSQKRANTKLVGPVTVFSLNLTLYGTQKRRDGSVMILWQRPLIKPIDLGIDWMDNLLAERLQLYLRSLLTNYPSNLYQDQWVWWVVAVSYKLHSCIRSQRRIQSFR